MDTPAILALVVVGLAALTLVWCIYHAGKDAQRAREAQEDLTKAVEVEKLNNDLEKQSAQSADDAIAAGIGAGVAPDDPAELPDAVRARIFGRKR